MKISELATFPDKMPIDNLTATVKTALETKRGESQHGPWTSNGFILEDGQDECYLGWFDAPAFIVENPKSIEGRSITVSSSPNNKGYLVGAKKESYTKDGQERVSIKVSDADHVTLDGQVPMEATQPSPTTQPKHQGSPPAKQGLRIGKDLLPIADQAIRYVADSLRHQSIEPSCEAVCAVANTLLIAITNGKATIDEDADDDDSIPF